MHKNLIKEPQSSFLSCEKDMEIILRKLFVDSKPHSDVLKKLLTIPMKDCLAKDGRNVILYNEKIKNMTMGQLLHEGYLVVRPRIELDEHEEIKTYIVISFDRFTTNATNPQFRDCTVNFDIICHISAWDLEDYQSRPLKIAGYIDGLLNNTKLTGIGEFHFLGCNEIVLNEELSGYTLSFRAIHGSDDLIPPQED